MDAFLCCRTARFSRPGVWAATTVVGEVVFNTSLTGYQEVITDPSYRGQMVCMTLPHVGNTGVNAEDVESDRPQITAFIVREVSPVVSNWRANETLPAYLTRHGIPGISEVDTRGLTRHLRDKGVLHAALCTDGRHTRRGAAGDGAHLGRAGRPRPCARSHLPGSRITGWTSTGVEWTPVAAGRSRRRGVQLPVHAVDLALRSAVGRRLRLWHQAQHPAPPRQPRSARDRRTRAHDGRRSAGPAPDGIFLSNGPGDPAGVPYAAEAVRQLLESGMPTFGICLGHQIIGLALGARTYKLKFGHHGSNQPVSDVDATNVQITAQNHNYAVDEATLPC